MTESVARKVAIAAAQWTPPEIDTTVKQNLAKNPNTYQTRIRE